MDPATATVLSVATVLIVLIISVASVIGTVKSARLRAERGLRKDWLGNEVPIVEGGAERAVLQKEVEELRDRVRVLERIATDKRVHLADEIEDLRNEKSN